MSAQMNWIFIMEACLHNGKTIYLYRHLCRDRENKVLEVARMALVKQMHTKALIVFIFHTTDSLSMEIKGFEPLTPCLQGRCSPN